MTQDKCKSLFVLAGFEIVRMWKLENQYWPSPILDGTSTANDAQDFIHYQSLRLAAPWWLVKTKFGCIEIGWRKRVIEIDWRDTPFRGIITADETTKGEAHVHAWTELKAAEYLSQLREHLLSPEPETGEKTK